MKRRVKILGREVGVTFNLQAEICYEQICGKPFDPKDMDSVTSSYALFAGAILACRDNEGLPEGFVARMLDECTHAEWAALREAVAACMEDFFALPPATVTGEAAEATDEGGTPPNA